MTDTVVMTDEPLSDPAALHRSLAYKLAPDRFPNMSGRMAAIVGYILDEPFAEPAIIEMTVTSTGGVLAVNADDTGHNSFIGDRSDLDRNLVGLLTTTPDLTEEEIALFGRLQRDRIKRW